MKENKKDKFIILRVTSKMKSVIDKLADGIGQTTSDFVREILDKVVFNDKNKSKS